MAARRNQPQPSMAPFLIPAGVAGAGAAIWFGYPGMAAVWAVFVVAAWTEPQPPMTGRKDSSGMPTPAGVREERSLRMWRFWSAARWRLVVPSSSLLPGWPPLGIWLTAVVAAAAAAHLPVNVAWFRFVNAGAVFVTVAVVAAARRSGVTLDDVCPGASVKSLRRFASTRTGVLAAVLAAAAGVAAGVYSASQSGVVLGLAPGAPDAVAADPPLLPALMGPVSLGVSVGLLVSLVLWLPFWSKFALGHWREVVGRRSEWKPRWASLKHDPAPFLSDTKEIGLARIDTFDAPAGVGAMGYWPIAAKIVPTLGAGGKVAVLETPDEGPEGPIPGTRHPLQFEVVTWSASELPCPADPAADEETIELFSRCAMVWTLEGLGYGRPVPLSVEKISSEDSPVAAWASTWAWPVGPSLTEVRSVVDDLSARFGCDVLVDHRKDMLYFGGLLNPETVYVDESHTELMNELSIEDDWNSAWGQVLKQDANPPTIQHSTFEERKLSDGTIVVRQAFMTRLGIDPGDFRGLEPKLATVKKAAPFVAVCGWPGRSDRAGERHPQAFVVYWSEAPVPSTPDRLAPSQAAPWVIAGRVNQAFDSARLARPELVSARALTEPRGIRHLWTVTLRLYGGVTLADVRAKAGKLQTTFGSAWLRIAEAPDGCVLYVGSTPDRADLVSPERDRLLLTSLDWEQAWSDAKVVGVGGRVPELVDTTVLPMNEAVQVLTFELPPGVDRTAIKEGVEKLRVATSNEFVEVRDSDSASSVRLLVSQTNPLPPLVDFDFKFVDSADGIPFADGIEGEPIEFDPQESPHVLLAGVTGAGKMQPLDERLPVPSSSKFPDGWATIGELRVGDEVFGPDGSTAEVIALSEVVSEPVHTVFFGDSQRIRCGPDHLWKVALSDDLATNGDVGSSPGQQRNELTKTIRRLASAADHRQVATAHEVAWLAETDTAFVRRVVPDELIVNIEVGGTYPLGEALLLVADELDRSDGIPAGRAGLARESLMTAATIREVLADVGFLGLSVCLGAPVVGPKVCLPTDPYMFGVSMAADWAAETPSVEIPTEYLRASVQQRSWLLDGLAVAGRRQQSGSVVFDNIPECSLAGIVELARSLGRKVTTATAPRGRWWVEVSARHQGTAGPDGWLGITGVTVGPPVDMRCIVVDRADHMYLTGGFVPTHNSVLAQAFIYGALVKHWSVFVIDPVKGGADFRFAKNHSRAFASDAFEAAAVMRAVYDEIVVRKNLNAKHGVGSFRELPDEIRPAPILVFIDEFTSLLGRSPVPPKSDDPTMTAERAMIEAENQAKVEVGVYAGKIAREARSAGVSLALGTQKLSAKMLDTIPGASDLKDLSLDTRLPVPVSEKFPSGWARNDELELGDLLFTPAGGVSPIVGFSDVITGNDVYEVVFDDGQVVTAGAGHLWEVSEHRSRRGWRRSVPSGRRQPSERVMTTVDLSLSLTNNKGAPNWAVGVSQPVACQRRDLPVDPYVLGAWLGDGYVNSGTVISSAAGTCVDEDGLTDQSHMMTQLGNAGYQPYVLKCDTDMVGTYGLKAELQDLGVLHQKHIPAIYLRASVPQRLALLQGLMDTSGALSVSGQCAFTQVGKAVFDGAVELARSLGIKVELSGRQGKCLPAEATTGKDTGRVYNASFRTGLPVFRLPRKLAHQTAPDPNGGTSRRLITDVRLVESVPTRCIGVADPGHLFLVEGFIATHNTNLARALLGKASSGDRMSALRAFDDAPPLLGDIPKGRGLWEPLTSAAVVIQTWFATQAVLEEQLCSRVPALTDDEVLDLGPYLRLPAEDDPIRMLPVEDLADVVVDIDGIELCLGDLEAAVEAPVPAVEPPAPAPPVAAEPAVEPPAPVSPVAAEPAVEPPAPVPPVAAEPTVDDWAQENPTPATSSTPPAPVDDWAILPDRKKAVAADLDDWLGT